MGMTNDGIQRISEEHRYETQGAEECLCMEPGSNDPGCPVHNPEARAVEAKRRVGPPCTCGAENLALPGPHGPDCIFELARVEAADMFDRGEIDQEGAKLRLINWESYHPEYDIVIREKWGKDIAPSIPDEVKVVVGVDPARGEDHSAVVLAEVSDQSVAILDTAVVSKGTVDIWVWRTLQADEEGPRHPSVPQFARISLDSKQVQLLNAQAPIPPGYHAGNWAIHDPDGNLDLSDEEA